MVWQDECFALRFEHIDRYASRTGRHKPGGGNCYGCVVNSNHYLLEEETIQYIPPMPDRLLCLFRQLFVFIDEHLHLGWSPRGRKICTSRSSDSKSN